MRKIFFSGLLIFFFVQVFAQNKDADTIKKLNQAWLNAYRTKDTATMSKIFAADFILISPGGAKMTKAAVLDNVGKQEIASVAIDSCEVRVLTPTTAVITAYTSFTVKVDGKDVKGQNCYQDVYVKRKNNWFAVAAHVTLLNMK